MNKISEIINAKYTNILWIDSSKLSHSGTGYMYASLCDETITQFNERNRHGYLIQISILNVSTGKKYKSCFLVHCRYSNDEFTVVYSGPYALYYDCIIHKEDKAEFNEKLKIIINGGILESKNEDGDNMKICIGHEGEECYKSNHWLEQTIGLNKINVDETIILKNINAEQNSTWNNWFAKHNIFGEI